MVRVSLSLGIIAAVAGLMAIGFGIPIQAFGLGNTLILAGSTVFSAGLIVIALSLVLRALDRLSQDLRSPAALEAGGSQASFERPPAAPPSERPAAPPPNAPDWPPPPIAPPRDDMPYAERPEPRRPPLPPRSGWQDEGAAEPAALPSVRPPGAPPPRLEREPPPPRLDREAGARPRMPGRTERLPREPVPERAPQAAEPERRHEPAVQSEPADERAREALVDPYAPPERRRVFGWTRRSKDRRDETTAGVDGEVEPDLAGGPPRAETGHAFPASPGSRELPRAPARPPAPPEPRDRPPPRAFADRSAEQVQPVEVLKQGNVDGMSYTLYTDGSIDAEFPEGRIRFNSIEDLRQHLEAQG